MKILDETGAVVENPDLTLGYLTDQHRRSRPPRRRGRGGAVALGDRDRVPQRRQGCAEGHRPCRACLRRPHGPNRCPSRSTSATPPKSWPRRKKHAKRPKPWEKLPDTVAALQEDNKTLKEENKMLKQCLMEMSEIVYA